MANEDGNITNQENIDLGSKIDVATSANEESSLQQPAASPEDLALIRQSIQAGTPSAQIGDPGQAALFPGLNQSINVGSSSGQIIGSRPIFVPTGNVQAVGAQLERRKAQAIADQKKAELFRFERPDVPQQSSFVFILSAILIGTALLLVLIKFKKMSLWKLWFFLVFGPCR